MSDFDDKLRKMYYPPTKQTSNPAGSMSNPTGRAYGRNNLYRLMKEKYPNDHPSRTYVGEWLKKQAVGQVYSPQRKTVQVQQFVPTSPFNQLSCDLLNFRYREVKSKNYVLIVIDNFSRYAFTRAIKDKTQPVVSKAMRQIFDQIKAKYAGINGKFKFLVTDGGNEFMGETDDVFKEFGLKVKRTNPSSPWENGMVERAGGKIKKLLAKMIYPSNIPVTRKQKKRKEKGDAVVYEKVKVSIPKKNWVNFLQAATTAYNGAYNRGIGMSSNDALGHGTTDIAKMSMQQRVALVKKNNKKAYAKYYENKEYVVNQTSQLKVGDRVRLKKNKNALSKSIDPNWSEDTYTVEKVIVSDMEQVQDRYEISKKGGKGAGKLQYYRNDLLLTKEIKRGLDVSDFKVGLKIKVYYPEYKKKYVAEIKRVNRLSILVKWLEGEDKDLETLITEQNYNRVERA